MLTVYGYSPSGNCHKVRMLLAHLGREHRWVEVDSAHGATRTPEFLAKNPNGRVPILEREDGSVLAESNAILYWLADATPGAGEKFFGGDSWGRAQILSWMFFEQYSHEPYIAVARFIRGWTPIDSPRRAELPKLRERGNQALAVMENHLRSNAWFSGADYGVADIALFAYTHCAGDGGFDLSAFPAVVRWLQRVAEQPGFVPMAAPTAANAALLALSH
jgi:glutathione S-transferase